MDGDDDFKAVKKTANEQTADKYGEDANGFTLKDNDDMKDGFNRNRKLTDLLLLAVYIAFIFAMGFCTSFGYKNGNVKKLTAPLDGADNFCGIGNFSDYPQLYITKLDTIKLTDIFNSGVCVKKCPVTKGDLLEAKANTITTDVSALKAAYATKNVVSYCFPASTKNLGDLKAGWNTAKKAFLENPAGAYFNDMYLSSRAIYASFGMGVLYCFLYIMLMSYFAETIAWVCVGVAQIAFIGLAVAAWFMRSAEVEKYTANTNWSKDLKDSSSKKQAAYLAGVIVFAIIAALFACCVYCGYESLKMAIDVIDAAADFIAKTKRIILVPVLYFVLTLIVILVWVGAMTCIASMNTIAVGNTSIVPQDKDVKWDNKTSKYMSLFMLFGLLWICAWIKYTNQFICMVSASTYYFNSDANKDGEAEVGLGFKYAHVYHTGSLAAGSFIIAVIQFIRIVFMYLAKKA